MEYILLIGDIIVSLQHHGGALFLRNRRTIYHRYCGRTYSCKQIRDGIGVFLGAVVTSAGQVAYCPSA